MFLINAERRHEKSPLARENLSRVPAALSLEEKMGKGLERGQILLKAMREQQEKCSQRKEINIIYAQTKIDVFFA